MNIIRNYCEIVCYFASSVFLFLATFCCSVLIMLYYETDLVGPYLLFFHIVGSFFYIAWATLHFTGGRKGNINRCLYMFIPVILNGLILLVLYILVVASELDLLFFTENRESVFCYTAAGFAYNFIILFVPNIEVILIKAKKNRQDIAMT